jgi:hypothetical protein
LESELNRRVEITGRSGRAYSFVRIEGEHGLRPVGGTYVIAHAVGSGWKLLGVGHTNNLSGKDWNPQLAEVRAARPDAEVLIRLNVTRGDREAEVADLEPLAQRI